MQVLPRLFKLWPRVDLDPFYANVKFGHKGFCMGKSENYLFFGKYCNLRSQSCLKHSAKWVNEVEWVSKVKVILWPWSKVTQISKLNVWLWPVYSGERFRASLPSCFMLPLPQAWRNIKIGFSIPSSVHMSIHPSFIPFVQVRNSETLWDTLTKLDTTIKHYQTMWHGPSRAQHSLWQNSFFL